MPKTVLAIGAHYDDAAFGVPGILLSAVRKHYRVVVLSLIGDYTNWKPVRGRAKEVVEGTTAICREYGIEKRFLDFASMKFEVTEANKRAVAAAVAEIKPDVAFMLWPHDRHADHEVASRLSKIALRHGDRLVDVEKFKRPRRIYLYDNGPGHTIGFEPDTFVKIDDEWPQAVEWLGKLMALVRNQKYDPAKRDGAQRAKESLARYRGMACGARYAEAIQAANSYPQEIL